MPAISWIVRPCICVSVSIVCSGLSQVSLLGRLLIVTVVSRAIRRITASVIRSACSTSTSSRMVITPPLSRRSGWVSAIIISRVSAHTLLRFFGHLFCLVINVVFFPFIAVDSFSLMKIREKKELHRVMARTKCLFFNSERRNSPPLLPRPLKRQGERELYYRPATVWCGIKKMIGRKGADNILYGVHGVAVLVIKWCGD